MLINNLDRTTICSPNYDVKLTILGVFIIYPLPAIYLSFSVK
jgi:hypothetical protein